MEAVFIYWEEQEKKTYILLHKRAKIITMWNSWMYATRGDKCYKFTKCQAEEAIKKTYFQ